MSIRAINWAIHLGDREGVTPTMRHVLLVLSNFASDEDISYPRQKILAKITGRSRQCIIDTLKELEAVKLITSTGRKRGDGGTRSSEYQLHIDENPAVDQALFYKTGVKPDDMGGVKRDDMGVVSKDTPGQAGGQGGVKQDDTLNHTLEPSPEPSTSTKPRKRKTAPWPADYREQFWKLYPKKAGDSRKAAWAKLDIVEKSDEVEFEDLMNGLRHYADRMNTAVREDRKNERFIAAASVWVNQARWETERAPDRTPPRPRTGMAI